MSNDRVIKSYVWHNDKCFFVSTIERDSSAEGDTLRFNETIVWEYDWKSAERGAQIFGDGSCRGSVDRHLEICRDIYKHGKVMGDDE